MRLTMSNLLIIGGLGIVAYLLYKNRGSSTNAIDDLMSGLLSQKIRPVPPMPRNNRNPIRNLATEEVQD